jgi:hypothetical protein
MKKHIPQTLLQLESVNTSKSKQDHSAMLRNNFAQHPHTIVQQPVRIDELIESISQRNQEAMSPLRKQKTQNRAVLDSVLRSIFSS